MATTRSLSSAALPSPVSPGSPVSPIQNASRHRLRAVDPDEVVQVADLLPPGATWLPAPQHTLPSLPGRPEMVGYLVLIPADQQQPFQPDPVPSPQTGPQPQQGAGAPLVRVDTVQRTAEVDGRQLDLTYLEFELLAHLVAHPNRVHTER